ncbi:hypothetical protein CMQ_1059 [Grosmannia clavigera kw1407]|uniref:Uncharacterized protein n=1 Tax=Grosmannia clavigera (strain kw1407 / UAMH 11150) TaxID=655863 RepID=F0XD63_GROCL|nr:uncharacterized protein CMQ_1059 [Grosmannia clavigera kw1407]EFX04131.1 hypothetical protein CMQ_1059 [Grosmannia clavigera kw1407]
MDDEPAEGTGAPSAVRVVTIAPRGDVVLDVVFETSTATLRAVRADRRLQQSQPLQRHLRVAFRVDAAVLRTRSRYFANLLGDTRFQEARAVEAALAALALDGVAAADVEPVRLPWVRIDDDDEGSRSIGREVVFEELLRMLHGLPETPKTGTKTEGPETKAKPLPRSVKTVPKAKTPVRAKTAATTTTTTKPDHTLPGSCWSAKTPPSLRQLAVLALQADRFDCAATVAAHVRSLRVRFPQPVIRAEGGSESKNPPGLANEEAIRQKIFVAWVLDQPVHFDRGTRELILYGSQQWDNTDDDDDDDDDDEDDSSRSAPLPAWWDLPDGLEAELRFRRACIVRCIASVPRHFLGLYTSRGRRECKMGYGSSAACDSFQLGEMVRFLCQRDLLHLRVFGPSSGLSPSSATSLGSVDVYHILAALRQCPAYQLDRDHVNCGLRTRMLPILEYIQAMLTAGAVAVRRQDWRAAPAARRGPNSTSGPSWEADQTLDTSDGNDEDFDNDNGSGPLFAPSAADRRRVFRFTRAVAGDQRLRLEGNIAADRMARTLFTARRWNWTPED